jgi:ATPase family AAA domain-containing protein 3A/B
MQERIKMEKDLAEKKELIRRDASEKIQKQKQESEEDFNQKRLEYEKEKIRAEVELRAQQERENEDLNIRKLKVQAELESEQIISTITVLFDELGKMLYGIISQPQKIAIMFSLVLAFIFSYYGVKEFMTIVRSTIQSYIGKPSLVRETSMHWHYLPVSLADWLSKADDKQSLLEIEKHFQGVALGDEDRERVIQLALTTRNTKNTSAPYRHVLLHGPPGNFK